MFYTHHGHNGYVMVKGGVFRRGGEIGLKGWGSALASDTEAFSSRRPYALLLNTNRKPLEMDTVENQPPMGMSSQCTPESAHASSAERVSLINAPIKRLRPVSGARPSCTESRYRHKGKNGFEYVISFGSGCVLLKAKDCDGVVHMCTEDWLHFREHVTPELDVVGWSEPPAVTQWCGVSGSVLYRMESTLCTTNFIFFKRCVEPGAVLGGCDPFSITRHPRFDGYAASGRWFETVFFIQRCDWPAIRSIFEKIDRVVKKYPTTPTVWYPYTPRIPGDADDVKKQLFLSNDNKVGASDHSDVEMVSC